MFTTRLHGFVRWYSCRGSKGRLQRAALPLLLVLGQPQSPLPEGFSFKDAALQEMGTALSIKASHLGSFLVMSEAADDLFRSLPELG